MPDQKNSNNPSSQPESQPLAQPPVVPLTRQEDEMGEGSNGRSNDENKKAIQLETDIRSGERWLIGISAASVILNVVIALIYYGQLKEMRKATRASEKAANAAASAADTADKTLKEIRAGGTDTHELAVQARKQAESSLAQARSMKVQAEISQRNLVVVQRPFLAFADLKTNRFNQDGKVVRWQFFAEWENTGNTPAKKALIEITSTEKPTDKPLTRFLDCRDDPRCSTPPIIVVIGPKQGARSSPVNVTPEAIEQATNGKHFYLWGIAEYDDPFPGTKRHVTKFCRELVGVFGNEVQWVGCGKHECADEDCEIEK